MISGISDRPCLVVKDLSKTFTIHALGTHINACSALALRVEHGEFAGITGRSGSGKSTVLRMLYRSYLPEAGSIDYDSAAFGPVDLATLDERKMLFLRRHEIGYVSQFLQLMPRTTAREAIAHAVVEAGGDPEAASREASRMLEHFELDRSLWDSYVQTFSGGEKLRLNIARAMVTHPRLLLLDEPTASLDNSSKLRVRQLIEGLKAEGTTMVGIFHDLEFMQGLCDKTYTMAEGRIA